MRTNNETYQIKIDTEGNLILPVIIGVGTSNEKLLKKGSSEEDPFVTPRVTPTRTSVMDYSQHTLNSNVMIVTRRSTKVRNNKAGQNLGRELDKIMLTGKR